MNGAQKLDTTASPRPTVLDLFAGAGGFSLGFELAGYQVIGGIEIDKWASETFSSNHHNSRVINADICHISNEEIAAFFQLQHLDVLIGGPPCQGFSHANVRNGDPKDPRNSLFREFLRIAAEFRPNFIVIENVPGIAKARTADKRWVVDIIVESLQDMGYTVFAKILLATDYGVPQIRQRFFVIASLVNVEDPFPTPTHFTECQSADEFFPLDFEGPQRRMAPTLWEAISDLPPLHAGAGMEVQEYGMGPQNWYQEQMRFGAELLYNHKAMSHSKRMVQRFEAMKCGDTVNDVPHYLKPRKRNSMVVAKVAYDQNNRRMHPDKPCHTIPASFYANFVHPFQHRNFTAREGARIQSFPDWFRFMGKPTVVSHKLLERESRDGEKFLCQYNQIGNAVPPLLARAIAQNVFEKELAVVR